MLQREFQPMPVPGTAELVFARPVDGKPELELRVYSSIDSRGEARDVGADAIRVVIYAIEFKRGIGSEARVYRINTWAKNLDARIREADAHARFGLKRCAACGA